MKDRDSIQAMTMEHKSLKYRATEYKRKNLLTTIDKHNLSDKVTIYKSLKVTKEITDFEPAIKIVTDILESISVSTMGTSSENILDGIDVYILDDYTLWIEIFVNNNSSIKSKFYGRNYIHITSIRNIISAYSGRTGVYVAIGTNR